VTCPSSLRGAWRQPALPFEATKDFFTLLISPSKAAVPCQRPVFDGCAWARRPGVVLGPDWRLFLSPHGFFFRHFIGGTN